MIGSGACIGAALPPKPETTCPVMGDGAGGVYAEVDPNAGTGVDPQLAGGVKLVLGAVLMVFPPSGADPKLGTVVCAPPLFAPAIFSCVRPNAAIPSTAPIAMWNNPAPCSVSGFH